MRRVLLFGGTFDPPHNGHLNNLRAAVAACKADVVLVMPVGTPPHKDASHTPGAIRLEMCRCFAAALPGGPPVEVSNWEIERQGRSYTIDTMRMLRARFPGAHLYLAVGSDMLRSFEEWREWRGLLALATLVVESRRAGDGPALKAEAARLRAAGGHIVFARAPVLECSSTAIRAGKIPPAQRAALLPPEVRACIEKYNLYKSDK